MLKPSTILLERLSRLLQNDAHATGLKPTQWEVVRYLSRANRFSRSPGNLTIYLGMTKGTVSQTLQVLERKGLIVKTATERDRRGVMLDLTEAGENLLAGDPLNNLDTSIAAMPSDERDVLGLAVKGLLKDMLDRRGGRPFGSCKSCRYFNQRHDQGSPHFCGLLHEPLTLADSDKICVEQEPVA